MGWGNKAIEIRSAETGHLDGVFMHKHSQQLRFLCERNDKVRPFSLKEKGIQGLKSTIDYRTEASDI